MSLEIVEYVNKCIVNKDDFTVRENSDGELFVPISGYVVSITPLINIGMDENQMLKYILEAKFIKIERKDYYLYLGGWFEKDKLNYDISVVIESKKEAIEVGKYCNQIAIYDLLHKQTILI